MESIRESKIEEHDEREPMALAVGNTPAWGLPGSGKLGKPRETSRAGVGSVVRVRSPSDPIFDWGHKIGGTEQSSCDLPEFRRNIPSRGQFMARYGEPD